MNQPNARIYLETLEEIAESDDLLNAFADETLRHYGLTAPHDFADSVMKKSRTLNIQAVAKTNQASRKLQLLIYGLRVGVAVAGALVLLFALPPWSEPHSPSERTRIETQIASRSHFISDSLTDFSYEIFDWR